LWVPGWAGFAAERDQARELERLAQSIWPTSRAVTSAIIKLPCSSALRNAVRRLPWEVMFGHSRGRDGAVKRTAGASLA
jgi:hypothetical protein